MDFRIGEGGEGGEELGDAGKGFAVGEEMVVGGILGGPF